MNEETDFWKYQYRFDGIWLKFCLSMVNDKFSAIILYTSDTFKIMVRSVSMI